MDYSVGIKEAPLSSCEKAASFLQSAMWGGFKSRFGWKAKAFTVECALGETQESFPLLVLCRKLMPGFSFAYVPWGPQLTYLIPVNEKTKAAAVAARAAYTAQIAKMLKPFLARNTVLIRFEPPWTAEQTAENREQGAYSNEQTTESDTFFLAAGFKKAAAVVQPPDTVIIDLSASREEILAAMKPKWRYNVSLAEKKGVKVSAGGIKEMEIFYSLLKETAVRDGISVHNFEYYKTLFEICNQQNNEKIDMRLYTASHENDILAAIVVLFRGKEATYLYGASSNIKRNLMAPYALQWKAMQDAKDAGCICYDLFGIPPNEDPNHPMAGLYRFKTGFGGEIIHRAGTWDYACKPFIYFLFKKAEKIRKKLMDLKKRK